jgi:hypothetical protein
LLRSAAIRCPNLARFGAFRSELPFDILDAIADLMEPLVHFPFRQTTPDSGAGLTLINGLSSARQPDAACFALERGSASMARPAGEKAVSQSIYWKHGCLDYHSLPYCRMPPRQGCSAMDRLLLQSPDPLVLVGGRFL